MMEFLQNLIPDFVFGVSKLLLQIFIIILGILVGLEILKALKILDFLNNALYKVTRYLGISKTASLPLFVGLLAGITYGAGSIIANYKVGDMSKKDVLLVSVFMCLCHAIIEDTLIFISIGANGWVIFFVRFLTAVFVTMTVNFILTKIEKKKIKNEIKESL